MSDFSFYGGIPKLSYEFGYAQDQIEVHNVRSTDQYIIFWREKGETDRQRQRRQTDRAETETDTKDIEKKYFGFV